jgi:hypothetical protein
MQLALYVLTVATEFPGWSIARRNLDFMIGICEDAMK